MEETKIRGNKMTVQLIFAPEKGTKGIIRAKDGRAYFANGHGQLTRPNRLRGKAAVKAHKRARALARKAANC